MTSYTPTKVKFTDGGGTWLFCDTNRIAAVASPKRGVVYPKRPEEETETDPRKMARPFQFFPIQPY